MSNVFTIKKNDVYLKLTSNDKNLLKEEFDKFAQAMLLLDAEISFETNLEVIEVQESTPSSPTIQELIQPSQEIEQPQVEPADFPSNIEQQQIKPTGLPANFANILAIKSEETSNVIEKKTSELQKTYMQMQNIIKEKSLKSEIDYIVAAAYCISRYEGAQRFTEEQINAKAAPFLDDDIDHNSILTAVNKNLIRVLPDFTGVSDIIEFELTDVGEDYFSNEL